MRSFVTTFAGPVIGAVLVYVLLGQLQFGVTNRIYVCVGLVVAAAIASWLVEEKQEQSEERKRSGKIRTAIGSVLALVTVLLLVFFSHASKPSTVVSTTLSQSTRDVGSTPPEVAADSRQPSTKSSEQSPDDWLLHSLKALPKSNNPRQLWVLLVTDSTGGDHPGFRTGFEQSLSEMGVTIPALLRPPSKAMVESLAADTRRLTEIKPYCHGFILADVESQSSESDQLSRLYTTHLKADVRIVFSDTGQMKELFEEADGAGATDSESRTNAEKRSADGIRKQLTNLRLD